MLCTISIYRWQAPAAGQVDVPAMFSGTEEHATTTKPASNLRSRWRS